MNLIKIFIIISFGSILFCCSNKATELVKPTFENILPHADKPIVSAIVKIDSVEGDSYTNSVIHVEIINQNNLEGNFTINFQTTHGIFSNGASNYSVIAASDGKTEAYLRNNRPEIVNVTVTISNIFSKTLAVHFIDAKPDIITIEIENAIMKAKSHESNKVKTFFRRMNGYASPNQFINYYDSTSKGGYSIGTFLNSTPSNNDGTAVAEYYLQDTTYFGYLYIIGYINSGNRKISGKTRVLIK